MMEVEDQNSKPNPVTPQFKNKVNLLKYPKTEKTEELKINGYFWLSKEAENNNKGCTYAAIVQKNRHMHSISENNQIKSKIKN